MKKALPVLLCVILLLALAAGAYADGSVSIDAAHFPDETFRQYVKTTWDQNGDNVLSADEIAAVQNINLSENDTWKNGIASLDGIQYFTNLRTLRADAMPNISGDLDFSSNNELVDQKVQYRVCQRPGPGCRREAELRHAGQSADAGGGSLHKPSRP